MSAERGRLRNLTQELLSTEDKILKDIKNHSVFKAIPLNRKLFEAKDTVQKAKPESTKVEGFKLSVSNAKAKDIKDESQNFKALAFNKRIFKSKVSERYSAPPKITQPKAFNLSTERRSRPKLEIKDIKVHQFKARAMPSFAKPNSPIKSTMSIEFKGK